MNLPEAITASVGILTIGGSALALFRTKVNAKNGNGRPQWMSKETKDEITKLNDEKQSKEHCITLHGSLMKEVDEVKGDVKMVKGTVDEIKTLIIKGIKDDKRSDREA